MIKLEDLEREVRAMEAPIRKQMTVGELIRALQDFEPDVPVVVFRENEVGDWVDYHAILCHADYEGENDADVVHLEIGDVE